MKEPKTRRENEIWQVCDELWAQNPTSKSITGDAIRDQLVKAGFKKGSPNEIYKYRQSWRESRGISDSNSEDMPTPSDPISRAVGLVYQQLQEETDERIARMEQQKHEEIEAMKAHVEKTAQGYDEALKTIEQLKHENRYLKENNEKLVRELQQAQIELSKATERASLLEKKLTENKEDASKQWAQLQSITTKQREDFAVQFAETKAQAQSEIKELHAELKKLGQKAMDEAHELKLKLLGAETELTRKKKDTEEQQKNIASLKNAIATAKTAEERLRNDVVEAEKLNLKLVTEKDIHATMTKQLREDNQKLLREMQKITKQISKIGAKKSSTKEASL